MVDRSSDVALCNRGGDGGAEQAHSPSLAKVQADGRLPTPGSVGRMTARLEERIAEERSGSRSASPSPQAQLLALSACDTPFGESQQDNADRCCDSHRGSLTGQPCAWTACGGWAGNGPSHHRRYAHIPLSAADVKYPLSPGFVNAQRVHAETQDGVPAPEGFSPDRCTPHQCR